MSNCYGHPGRAYGFRVIFYAWSSDFRSAVPGKLETLEEAAAAKAAFDRWRCFYPNHGKSGAELDAFDLSTPQWKP
jgi:hypothetical protein